MIQRAVTAIIGVVIVPVFDETLRGIQRDR